MSVKANYFKVGLFVIVATILLIGAVIFWGAQALRQEKYLVETYMDESVKGLTEGSMVYYQGIQIGSVDSIYTAPVVYNVKPGSEFGKYIVVRIALTHERITSQADVDQFFRDMVKEGLCFQMKSSPLTGVAYLEAASYEDRKNPPEWTAWQPQYTYIPSVPSLMSTLTDSAEIFFKKLAAIDVQLILDNANNLIVELNKSVKDLQVSALKNDMQRLITNTDATIVQLRSLLRRTDESQYSASVEEILMELTKTIQQINLLIKYEYPNISLAIEDLRNASQNLKEGTADIKQQPSKLFFSQPPVKSETVK